MPNSQLLDIFLIAMVAGIILFRLYSVLGRRTGHEHPPRENYRLPGTGAPTDAKIAALSDRQDTPPIEKLYDPAARGLLDIKLADRGFDTDRFVAGARRAYETVSAAFAAGDRLTLRPLLGDEVYAAFDAAIKARETGGEKISSTFTGFRTVKIVGAALCGHIAEVTISFAAQFRAEPKNGVDAVPSMRDVTDVWTFSRDLRARDPNWMLVATSGDFA